MTVQQLTQVLVTGASSYIGLHCILLLLEKGYSVRGTIRNLDRETHIRQVLARHTGADSRLEFFQADLTQDAGWEKAVDGCTYVLHLASPFPAFTPKDENDLIKPAREGTLRVLRAAADFGIKRVVLTSSIAAISGGHKVTGRTFDERDWSNLEGDIDAYSKSKTLAERAAWDFMDNLPGRQAVELAVINPSLVVGPVLDEEYDGTSGILVKELLKRAYPGCVDLNFQLVDVRDVAAAHLAAMTEPDAAGERFCCFAENMWMQEIAIILDTVFRDRGYPVRTNKLPNAAIYLSSIFDKTARRMIKDIGRQNFIDTSKIRRVLDWEPRSAKDSIVDMAESMIQFKLV
jgi:dihydroflavonol-4-reductase